MLVRLIRDCRVALTSGQTVDVSPDAYTFLTSTGCAVPVTDAAAEPAAKPAKKAGKKQ